MNLNIDKATFESVVPAFETCGDEVFTRLQQTIGTVTEELTKVFGAAADQLMGDLRLRDMARRYVCLRSARIAIPQLDLVLTQTGFGVVNTSNVAPASRDRVAALTEQLRLAESRAYDLLLMELAQVSAWRNSYAGLQMMSSLFWRSGCLRTHGITYEGETVYQEEFLALRSKIVAAETDLQNLISPELHDALIRQQDMLDSINIPYTTVIHAGREYMALHVMGHMEAAAVKGRLLQEYVRAHVAELPEFANSSLNQALNTKRYENKKDSRCHFW